MIDLKKWQYVNLLIKQMKCRVLWWRPPDDPTRVAGAVVCLSMSRFWFLAWLRVLRTLRAPRRVH